MVRNERPSAPRGRKSFEDSYPKRGRGDSSRNFSRDSSRGNTNRRDFEMTKVTCSSCGVECEVPFKPTTSKPLFCTTCFAKNGKTAPDRGSDRSRAPNRSNSSNRDLDIINEKLNKIMKALDIE